MLPKIFLYVRSVIYCTHICLNTETSVYYWRLESQVLVAYCNAAMRYYKNNYELLPSHSQ